MEAETLGDNSMAIDLREIELNDQQKRRIAEIAEQSGRPWHEVLDEKLDGPGQISREKPGCTNSDRYIEDYEKWNAYFQQWIDQQTSHNPNFDDSRDSIYD